MVLCPKSWMMSACVFSTQMESPTSSARRNSSVVDVTSAETQRLVCLAAMSLKRYAASGDVLGSSARSW